MLLNVIVAPHYLTSKEDASIGHLLVLLLIYFPDIRIIKLALCSHYVHFISSSPDATYCALTHIKKELHNSSQITPKFLLCFFMMEKNRDVYDAFAILDARFLHPRISVGGLASVCRDRAFCRRSPWRGRTRHQDSRRISARAFRRRQRHLWRGTPGPMQTILRKWLLFRQGRIIAEHWKIMSVMIMRGSRIFAISLILNGTLLQLSGNN